MSDKDVEFAEWISDLNEAPLEGATHGEIWAKVKEFRDAVAHELAEKQRAYASKHITPELDDVVEELTALIDPEVSSDG